MNGYDTTPPDAPNKEKPSKAALIKRFLTPKTNGGQSNRAVLPAAKKYPSSYTQFEQFEGYKQQKMLRDAAKLLGAENPFFGLHEGTAGATTVINGKECINFSSYDYLGLSSDPRVQQAAIEAIGTYGTSVSASRIVSGERPIHRELERALAETYQVDDALVFVSGHATNVSVIGHLFGAKDLIVHDALIHNSALVGAQLSGATRRSFPHNDTEALERLLIEQRDRFERVLIVVEGIYSMDGDAPDLPELVRIKNQFGALLMVDEAHSFGVLGATGLGLREHANVPAKAVDIWMGTLSKALAGCGGYIAGSTALIEQLRYSAPGFVYSVGMAPPVAAASLAALNILRTEPERVSSLHTNGRYFLEQARAYSFNTGLSMGYSVVPVVLGNSLKAVKLSISLLEQGINAQPIIYPAVEERAARLRFFISCSHQTKHIDQALAQLDSLK
ncbi:aminotransferase class I/II-fold pyridoxal phosphate-dependent enzyme [Halothiobacillus neapolitanus]|uniref:8-amino-7-oxononanoate synthase n=1 Tax=Halothiobacillus neapolitanus (strain ATCC 23641 / DSM 15147 / CIP 104769 / NCIMB 8539 / c2) TaxID=555778 RepID=D0L0W6_HALNC|nr:aminotransferase class I/II-fold pyridoxal phosphate-dependent enzyme [Halothiobacillus neapolitanus]ACX96339.1 8-amino-7-oxononanoate synthase [Halothiobacillus neapolitanus c2]TDN66653.1 8-amino-7-oxononanoate synthase [Halothiobacillus neapolitanus]